MSRGMVLIGALVLLVLVALSSIFIVDEREKALVLQFGQIERVQETPGLAFKVPFIQNVVSYDDRIQSLDTQQQEVTPLDDRRLVVDAFARWRISDVVQFRQAVGAGGIAAAEDRLAGILTAQIREVLGSVTSNTILSADRVALMNRIRDAAITRARALGIDVIDVRIKRTELPTQNLDATFRRMEAERAREAADERARGQEAAQRVRALADRTAVELVSEAQRDSDIIRGEADARRNAIFADAFGRDPEFFAFYRSLSAYENALGSDNSTMVITPDSEFFEYLKSDRSASMPQAQPLPAGETGASIIRDLTDDPTIGETRQAEGETGDTGATEELGSGDGATEETAGTLDAPATNE